MRFDRLEILVLIDNTTTTPASLTFGTNNQTVTLNGVTTRNSGAGFLTLTKTGTGAATISGGLLNHLGGTLTNGGSTTISAPVNGTNALSATGNSTLNLQGPLISPECVTSFTVGGGSTIDLGNGTGTPLTALTSLNLGAGGGTATVGLDIGSNATSDRLTSSSAATVANTVRYNLHEVAGYTGGTTTLLSATSGLTSGGATHILGTVPGGYTFSLNVTDTSINLVPGPAVPTVYWTGATDTKWATTNGTFQGVNFSTNAAGTIISPAIPGAPTSVIFNSTAGSVGTPAVSTTLEQNISSTTSSSSRTPAPSRA